MKRYLLPVLAAGCLLFAVASTLTHRDTEKTTLPPSPPPEANSTGAVAAVGLVEAPTEDIQLSCAVSGMVTALYVKSGDNVRAGQRLFCVDDRDLQADLMVKRATLDNARAQMAKLEAPSHGRKNCRRSKQRSPRRKPFLQTLRCR
jgi:multidrug efflux pump subunit AcrA (membrane-fusion protein)